MREYRNIGPRGRELRPWHLVATALVALLVGVVIGNRTGGDDGGSGVAVGDDGAARTGEMLDETAALVSTTTTTTATPPSQVVVVVLNGAGVQGEAARQSTELEALGYRALEPGNADSASQTVVYYGLEFADECEALRVAVADQRAEEVLLQPIDETIDSVGADCTVVLGTPVPASGATTPAAGATTPTGGAAAGTTTTSGSSTPATAGPPSG
jgi:hypothetical protein